MNRLEPSRAFDRKRALALLEDGASYTEVAETLGVCRKTVSKRLPGYGWTHRQGGAYGRMLRDLKPATVSRNPIANQSQTGATS